MNTWRTTTKFPVDMKISLVIGCRLVWTIFLASRWELPPTKRGPYLEYWWTWLSPLTAYRPNNAEEYLRWRSSPMTVNSKTLAQWTYNGTTIKSNNHQSHGFSVVCVYKKGQPLTRMLFLDSLGVNYEDKWVMFIFRLWILQHPVHRLHFTEYSHLLSKSEFCDKHLWQISDHRSNASETQPAVRGPATSHQRTNWFRSRQVLSVLGTVHVLPFQRQSAGVWSSGAAEYCAAHSVACKIFLSSDYCMQYLQVRTCCPVSVTSTFNHYITLHY